MPRKQSPLSVPELLGGGYIRARLERGALGGTYIRQFPLLMARIHLYEIGGVLGRALRERLGTLMSLIVPPGQERSSMRTFRRMAEARVAKYGGEPQTWLHFFLVTEPDTEEWGSSFSFDDAALSALDPELRETTRELEEELGFLQGTRRWGSTKMKINEGQLQQIVNAYVLEGVAFGARFPETLERLWRQTNEQFDDEEWAAARRRGLNLPEKPPRMSLEQVEDEVLDAVCDFAIDVAPELLEPLGFEDAGEDTAIDDRAIPPEGVLRRDDAMSARDDRPTLMARLGGWEVRELVESGMFGGPQVRLLPLLMIGPWLFSKGAALGRARADRIEVLATMLSAPGGERRVMEFLRDAAQRVIRQYGTDPDSLIDFWIEIGAPVKVDLSDAEAMRRLNKEKVPLERAAEWVAEWILIGIAFGSTFPELTTEVWRKTYESFDEGLWNKARASGLDIPKQFTPIPLQEAEEGVLSEVREYAMEYYPELVGPLGLRVT